MTSHSSLLRLARGISAIAVASLTLTSLSTVIADGERAREQPGNRSREGEVRRPAVEGVGQVRRGPRDGEGGVRRGPGDGAGPVKAGPRDGEGGPRVGPRDGEGAPKSGPREGAGMIKAGPREGDGARGGGREGVARPAAEGRFLTIPVDATGRLLGGEGQVMSPTEMRSELQRIAASANGRPIYIQADKGISTASIQGLVRECQQAGIKNLYFAGPRR